MNKLFRNPSKKTIILIVLNIFLFSCLVYYGPLWYKGYPPNAFFKNLILARNLHLTGQYKIESQRNVVLSSQLIREKGLPATTENKLTPLFYQRLFNLFGFNHQLPVYTSIILFALTNVLLFGLVLRLFNLGLALLFSLINLLTPMILEAALTPGFYELAIFFFAVGLLAYFYQASQKEGHLFLAGLFFGLASLARNAFVLSFIPLAIYEFYKNRSLQRALVLVLPFILLWGIFLGADYLDRTKSAYFSAPASFAIYGHLFPDPYTFHFEKEEFAAQMKETTEPNAVENLLKYGYPASWKGIIWMYVFSCKFYLQKFFRLIIIGGPLIIAFLIAGAIYLYQKKRYLCHLFGLWLAFWYCSLVILKTNNTNHFLELQFPLICLVSLGAYWLIQFFSQLTISSRAKYSLILIFLFCLFGHLIIADKWMFHEEYQTSGMKIILNLSQAVRKSQVSHQEVMAAGLHPNMPFSLNYWTDLNFVYFAPETIERLLREKQLKKAFDYFEVTKIIGYSEELSQSIIDQTGAENILSL